MTCLNVDQDKSVSTLQVVFIANVTVVGKATTVMKVINKYLIKYDVCPLIETLHISEAQVRHLYNVFS